MIHDNSSDSLYIALAAESLDELIKPGKENEWQKIKGKYFPRPEHHAYDKRTPGKTPCYVILCYIRSKSDCFSICITGLFKVEWMGDKFVGLNAKSYYCEGTKGDKYSSKGISHSNKMTFDEYKRVLKKSPIGFQTNRGFRLKDGTVHTYTVKKSGLTHTYVKRKVLQDGITTTYLDV